MRIYKRMACLFFVVMAAWGGVAASAKPEAIYRETALSVPRNLEAEDVIKALSVRGDRIDLISERQIQKPNDTFVLRHIRSDDGGNTWKEVDISWLNALQGDSNWQPGIAIRKDGTIYALLGEHKRVDTPKLVYDYYANSIVTHQNGLTKTICTFDDKNYLWHLPAGNGLAAEGDILLVAEGQDLKEIQDHPVPSRLLAIDAVTGEVKKNAPWDGDPMNKLLGPAFGKETTDNSDANPGGIFGSQRTSADAAYYEINASGLFRIQPGQQKWTKIVDRSACKMGTGGSGYTDCKALAAGEDGSIYVLRMHYNLDQHYNQELKAWTFSRYIPA